MSMQSPKPLEVIELSIEGLYEETFLSHEQYGGCEEFQMRAEVMTIKERRKAKMFRQPSTLFSR